MIALVAAVGRGGAIGRDNRLPWRLPADLRHFRRLTTGHTVIMGRKTYESIGRPLPDRRNVVVSATPDYRAPGCVVAASLEAALDPGEHGGSGHVFVIGGASLYRQALALAERLYLTEIDVDVPDADAFFPPLDRSAWALCSREDHAPDERNPYAYRFLVYGRPSVVGASSRRNADSVRVWSGQETAFRVTWLGSRR